MPAGSQAVGRLVEHQESRLAQQAGRDPEPLPHAVGVAGHLVVGTVGEVDDLEHLLDEAGSHAAVEQRKALEVLATAEVGVELRALDEARDAVEHRHVVLGPRPAEDADGAGVGADQPEEHPQEGGLPAPLGPSTP